MVMGVRGLWRRSRVSWVVCVWVEGWWWEGTLTIVALVSDIQSLP